jgi:hypothetical protein
VEEREAKKALLANHLLFQQQQRDAYYANAGLAKRHPNHYMSIIMDGAEPFSLPQTHPFPKAWIRAYRLPVHCYGIKNHGIDRPYIYLSGGQWSQDPNFVISILYVHIKAIFLQNKALPKILFLQVDNCARENKNRFLLAFCSLLLMWNLFTEITISFLPVGHTHEDIDQTFSIISRKYFHDIIKSYSDFGTMVVKALPGAHLLNVGKVWDWKSWLLPFMLDLSGHSIPLVFHIHHSLDGEVLIQSFTQHPIQHQRDSGVELLKTIPPGAPIRLQPTPLENRVKTDTLAACKHFEEYQQLQQQWTIQFDRFSKPVPEESLYDKHMFKWLPPKISEPVIDISNEAPLSNAIISVSGNYNPPNKSIRTGMVLAFRPDCSSTDRYWFGKVITIDRTSVVVQWYEKSKGKYWLSTGKDKQNRVKMAAIIGYNIIIMPNGTLHKKSKQKLKQQVEKEKEKEKESEMSN